MTDKGQTVQKLEHSQTDRWTDATTYYLPCFAIDNNNHDNPGQVPSGQHILFYFHIFYFQSAYTVIDLENVKAPSTYWGKIVQGPIPKLPIWDIT